MKNLIKALLTRKAVRNNKEAQKIALQTGEMLPWQGAAEPKKQSVA